jgi:hypothetical protein
MSKIKNVSIIIAILMLTMILTAVVLAASPSPVFTKTISDSTPLVGQPFTVTLNFLHSYTTPLELRVTDPNPAPLYLTILTPTITGDAVYSPTIDAVVWEGSVTGSSLQTVEFQMVATGMPAAAVKSGYPITNTAYIVGTGSTGSIPGSLPPGSLPNLTASASIQVQPSKIHLPIVIKK